jgi:tagatose-1,6-bisphosphate aldolase non-catalytic subunit AgaZ/GatZ
MPTISSGLTMLKVAQESDVTITEGTLTAGLDTSFIAAGTPVTAAGALVADAAKGFGAVAEDATLGDNVRVIVIGEFQATGGAAIAVDADVEVASGKYITHAAGVIVGRAKTACSGANGRFILAARFI